MVRICSCCLGVLLVLTTLLAGLLGAAAPDDPYPLGDDLAVLAADVESEAYRQLVLEKMLVTDLAAEWQRVETADNAERFAREHGGLEAVEADPQLKAAYERRVQIREAFLGLMRAGFKRYDREAPFDRGAVAEGAGTSAGAGAGARVPLAVVAPVADCEGQWPRFRGPSGQGETSAARLPVRWSETENVVWRTALPGQGNSSPVIWDDCLFVTSASVDGALRQVHALQRSTGELLWTQTAPQGAPEEGVRDKNGFASPTPVVDGQRVIALLGAAGLVAYDFQGKLLWQHALPGFKTMHGCGASPVLYGDSIILIHEQNEGKPIFLALDKRDGRLLWQHERPKAMGWCTPVIVRVGDHDELIHAGDGHAKGYDPATGQELWSLDGPTVEVVPACVVGDGLIYCCSGRNGPTLALVPGGRGDVTATHLVWRAVRGGPHVPSPLYYAGRLYTVNDTGIATCLDGRTGERIWQARIRDAFSASPIEAGGLLYFPAESGTTYLLRPGDKLEIVAENELPGGLLASPAVWGEQLFLRTSGEVFCIGEQPR